MDHFYVTYEKRLNRCESIKLTRRDSSLRVFSFICKQRLVEGSPVPLQMFCLYFRAEASIVKSNVDVLVSNGLGPRSHQDFLLAFSTCTALLKINAQKKVSF